MLFWTVFKSKNGPRNPPKTYHFQEFFKVKYQAQNEVQIFIKFCRHFILLTKVALLRKTSKLMTLSNENAFFDKLTF